jgi:glycosyltransferase involved in cell wall biosynthesis
MSANYSIVMPAKNEARNLERLLPALREAHAEAEIIVVNDGSTDDTVDVCESNGVKVVSHKVSRGNGASIKTGARSATRELIVFMDGDGQHKVEDIDRLLETYRDGNDMVVGARNAGSQASAGRLVANTLYNKLSSMITGQKILDLTSGFRVVNRAKFLKFLYLLPNGFSYPTTITMAFFRAGYQVTYIPIETADRLGKSHISLIKDGLRFLIIIFKIGTLYSPLRIFLPFSAGFFMIGVFYYLYTFATRGAFTNMGAVLFTSSIIVFLIGLVSEQITTLMYKDENTYE